MLCQWYFPIKNTGEGCHFLLQGNPPNPGIELMSPALQVHCLPLSYQGSPAKQHCVHQIIIVRKLKVSVTQLYLTLCHPMDCIARQAPLSMGFSRQGDWSGLLCPLPGDLPDPGIKLPFIASAVSPALTGEFFTTDPPGKLN